MKSFSNIHNPILVTGAAGKTGTAVVKRLLEKGLSVRALVRRDDARSRAFQQAGAEVVVANIYDYEDMVKALRGVKSAYFLPMVQPFMIHAASVFAVAAQETGLEYVAQMSQWIASPQHPSLHTRQLWLVEKLFATLPGIGHTVINPGAFAEPFLMPLPSAAQLGIYPNAFGGHKNAPPSNEDMAKVIVGCLIDPDKHEGKRYRPTGPQLLSMAEIAAAIGKAVGRDVKMQDVSMKMFMKAVKASGTNTEFEISSTQHYVLDGRLNAFEVNCPTTDVFDVSGEHPETFEETAKRYASSLPGVSKSRQNKLRAFGDVLKMIATKPYDLDKYDAIHEHPKATKPILASNSDRWLEEHRVNGRSQVLQASIVAGKEAVQ